MSHPTVSLRPALPGDCERMAELEELSLENPWSAVSLCESLGEPSALSWIAECGRDVVGFAVGRTAGDEAELLRIAVDPAWRRSGIGGELLARFLKSSLEGRLACVHLEVRAENSPARRLYERLGFVLAGVRTGYYADGTDAALYRRDLLRPLG